MSAMPRVGRCALSAAVLLITAVVVSPAFTESAAAQSAASSSGLVGPWAGKDFNQLDQAEKDAAKQAALTAHFRVLRVCADPGNMPLSDEKGQGYENKILEVLATAMHARLRYYWRAYTTDIVGQAFGTSDECDLLMDMPVHAAGMLPTMPLYRTTYVLVWRNDEHLAIKSLSDPALKRLRLGVFQISALRQALQNHGVYKNVKVWTVYNDTAWNPAHQPWRQVQEVAQGKLDVVGAWGPMAGWLKTMKHEPITIQPTNLMDNSVPMEFSLAIGVQPRAVVLRYALNDALKANRAAIDRILREYGVPLVECPNCLIAGNLPAHGSYMVAHSVDDSGAKPTHWTVSRAQVNRWLAEGSNVNKELYDAVLANDVSRAAYLISKGADVNKLTNLGNSPLMTAARAGCVPMMQLLVEHGANVNLPDAGGSRPLYGAVLRNRAPAIRFLLARGANPAIAAPRGYTLLTLAIEEQQFDAAYALIKAGVNVNAPGSKYRLTPLMIVASDRPRPMGSRLRFVQVHGPMSIARALIAHKANVNAADSQGVTALMIAAAHDNSPMIGLLIQAGADARMKSAAGETAHDIAVSDDNLGATRILDMLAHP